MSPLPERIPEPLIPRVSLNLRDDAIPPNYHNPGNMRDRQDDSHNDLDDNGTMEQDDDHNE